MEPFLKRIAKEFYSREGAGLKDYAFIFPNRRAGLFFRKYLAESAQVPIFSPVILTINELFAQLSDLVLCDRIQLLFRLYSVYRQITHTEESFDHFLFWGEIMLNDFDDIDKYEVDAAQLFSNLTDLRTLDANPLEYLSPEQLAAIRSFWSGFGEEEQSFYRTDFVSFWSHLFPVYSTFREELLSDGKAYEGMLMRQVVEKMDRNTPVVKSHYKKIVFVGFNALNKIEERFFLLLKKEGVADFYWDYSSEWIKDASNRSSFFMERNLTLFPSQIVLPGEDIQTPVVEIRGVASSVAQAKGVTGLLDRLYPKQVHANSGKWMETAIVLPDENLLFPLLSSIPEQIERINVTMGYSLSKSPIAGLLDLTLELHRNGREREGLVEFYHRDVLNLFNHRYLSIYRDDVNRLRQDIINNNRIFIEDSLLRINPLFDAVFRALSSELNIYGYLLKIIEAVVNILPDMEIGIGEEEEAEPESSVALEREFIDYYVALLNKVELSCRSYQAVITSDTYFKLLRKLVQSVSVPFQGEPLSGLQIMGVLETRVLDFENVVILSMNEGIFPLPKGANSLIPYNLRKGFSLPTTEHQDAVYAYHFYRLLQRAKNVYFFYDTRSDGLRSGEISRYIRQLKYLYRVPIIERLMVYNVGSKEILPLNIPKTEKVMERLRTFTNGGPRFLSASSVNTYLQCPLKFYLLYVQQLKEEEEIQERVEANVFGSLFHKTMELLYAPYCKRVVPADILLDMAKDKQLLDNVIRRSFIEVVYHGREIRSLEGEHLLIAEVIKRYVRQLLKRDAQLAPFEYLASEDKIVTSLNVDKDLNVNIKALIDRVDKVSGKIRLVDYKTGKGEALFSSVEQLFDRSVVNRPKEVLQLFLYALLYQQKYMLSDILPSIIFLRSIFKENSRGDIKQKNNRDTVVIDSFNPYKEEFSEALKSCLKEIFDPSAPFVQTDDKKACEYCSFSSLCS